MAQETRGHYKGHSTTASNRRANDLGPISRLMFIKQKKENADAAIGCSDQSFMTVINGDRSRLNTYWKEAMHALFTNASSFLSSPLSNCRNQMPRSRLQTDRLPKPKTQTFR
jgi:hypothetical protein